MKCQKCNLSEANVHYSEILNGKKREVYLCSECAMLEGVFQSGALPKFDAHSFLRPRTENKSADKSHCDGCSVSFEKIYTSKKAFCPQCYSSFQGFFKSLLHSVHGAYKHTGKLPSKASAEIKLKREYLRLKAQLTESIHAENYEQAALLRDEIRALEKQMHFA